ncbi:hypothetical protein EOPP23_11135 [Endozoicomonas sp. OPT23]|uniref:heme NO-binding domain-containing protein n=1 Tax=Endozoicomonas sp. OPT23 TaxID=2072845 RepID=UPI00129A6F7D|nr:heme NO-binding domain-containing protein [Endozoicomonas sp. OPT23]MRI33539.1 hypothetical protein [Endozoicomonas sp. OPT23]
MKGIVFTEFLEMVEDKFSEEIADKIIESSDLSSNGVYTSLGTYSHGEMLQLVTHLSKETGIEVSVLVKVFGEHLLGRFSELYPDFFKGHNCQSFLASVDEIIHGEVRKLYPDAKLPTFDCQETDNGFEMQYQSKRPFADLAEGLIHGAIKHFGEPLSLNRHDLESEHGPGTAAVFSLTREK